MYVCMYESHLKDFKCIHL